MKIKYILIIIISFYSSLLFGQSTFQIEGVKTILKYNEDSEFLVVLVHGSGKQDMEGSLSFGSKPECFYNEYANREFKLFDEISANLYELGFSTLRYDKLNNRKSIDKDFVVTDFIEDLNFITQKIQSDTQLKKKKIILFGWSEGVSVALNQLKYDLNIAGMILYGGFFMDPVKMKADAYYDLYKNCEDNEEKAKSYKYQFINQIEQKGQIIDNTYEKRVVFYDTLYNQDNTQIIGISKKAFSYTKAYFNNYKTEVFNSIKRFSNTEIPLLIIHGEKDVNVPIENHYYIRNKFKNQKNAHFKILNDSDHFMRKNFNNEINPSLFKFIHNWKDELKDK